MKYTVVLDQRVVSTNVVPVEDVYAVGFNWNPVFVEFFEYDEDEEERVVKTYNKDHIVSIEPRSTP